MFQVYRDALLQTEIKILLIKVLMRLSQISTALKNNLQFQAFCLLEFISPQVY